MIRAIWITLILFLLSGCIASPLLNKEPRNGAVPVKEVDAATVEYVATPCLVTEQESFLGNCDIWHWLDVWVKANAMSWEERKELINTKSTAVPDVLTNIILSQPKDTPYNDRLRAQHWFTDLKPKLTIEMQKLWVALIEEPSANILESTSAITMLSRVNGSQSHTIEEMQKNMKEQQKKLQALLNIEKSLMDKTGANEL